MTLIPERISYFLQSNKHRIWITYGIAHFTMTYFVITYAEKFNLFSVTSDAGNFSNVFLLVLSVSVFTTGIILRNKTWILALMAVGTGVFLFIGIIVCLPEILRGKSKFDEYKKRRF